MNYSPRWKVFRRGQKQRNNYAQEGNKEIKKTGRSVRNVFLFVRDGILSVADYNSSGMGVVIVGVVVVVVVVGVIGVTFHDGIT